MRHEKIWRWNDAQNQNGSESQSEILGQMVAFFLNFPNLFQNGRTASDEC